MEWGQVVNTLTLRKISWLVAMSWLAGTWAADSCLCSFLIFSSYWNTATSTSSDHPQWWRLIHQNIRDVISLTAHPCIAIFESAHSFDHSMMPWKFCGDISNGSGIIVLTDRQTDGQWLTDTTENNTTLSAQVAKTSQVYKFAATHRLFIVGWAFMHCAV